MNCKQHNTLSFVLCVRNYCDMNIFI